MGGAVHLGGSRDKSLGTLPAGRGPDADLTMSDLGPTMAGWLRANQKPDGRILAPVHREPGTYAAGFAGLAFGLMALRTGVTAWMDSCRLSVNTARQRPRDSEFDQLALLLA